MVAVFNCCGVVVSYVVLFSVCVCMLVWSYVIVLVCDVVVLC